MQLSFSAAQKYITSSLSWYLHYQLRLRPVQTGSALIFGSALDSGFNSLLLDKKSGNVPDLSLAFMEFDKELDSVKTEDIKFSKADGDSSGLSLDYQSPKDCLRAKGYILIEEYAAQVLPRIQEVYEIQKEISLTNELGDTFTGIIDLIAKIDDKILIVDNKSTSVKYAEDAVVNSPQLASYYEAMRNEYKLDGACYITVSKKLRSKKLPRVQIDFVFGSIPEELIEKTFNEYEQVLSGIKQGQFSCSRDQAGGCCSMPWPCSYRSYCISGGIDMTGLKYAEERKR